jgi:2-polyprenyl-3-methyl-5-hydroxy-6-metoxy-1,4-benzoquinol methylase
VPFAVDWYCQDLNKSLDIAEQFDVVVCSEVIEHLENPREVFRNLNKLLVNGGTLIVTMPNQESIRSYLGLLFAGHFVNFLGDCYPAHITALLRADLTRICEETGFEPCEFFYSDRGGIPKMPTVKWRQVSLGLLRGRLFSDNLAMITRKIH